MIFFIGPVARHGGPAIKNLTFITALQKRSRVRVYDTHKRSWHARIGAVLALLFAREKQIIIGVSRKGRRVLYPVLNWKKKRDKDLRICCILIGGEVARRIPDEGRHVWGALRGADLVTVETRLLARQMEDLGLQNVYYLPNYKAFDPAYRAPRKRLDKGTLRFVYLSSLRDKKGVKTLLDAFDIFHRENAGATLTLYGPIRTDFSPALLRRTQSQPGVAYGGEVANDQVLDTLGAYDVFVFPTEHEAEGFPAVLVEAQLAGLPIIASDNRFNPEIIQEGVNGFLFPTGDVHALVACMRRCVADIPLLRRMSEHNAQDARGYQAETVLEGFFDTLGAKGWTYGAKCARVLLVRPEECRGYGDMPRAYRNP